MKNEIETDPALAPTEVQQMRDLKPGPFCGGADIREDVDLRNYRTEFFCDECGAGVDSRSAAKARARWNSRVALTSPGPHAVNDDREAEVARLRRVLKSARTAMEIANKHGYSDWSDFIADIDAALIDSPTTQKETK